MFVTLRHGHYLTDIGDRATLLALFDTVAAMLEVGQRGSRFPVMADLYENGSMEASRAEEALRELRQIRQELARVTADRVVWRGVPRGYVPAEAQLRPDATNAADYLMTDRGYNLIDRLETVFSELRGDQDPLRIWTFKSKDYIPELAEKLGSEPNYIDLGPAPSSEPNDGGR